MEHIYDVIIIGGGPSGYAAALYCARANLDTIVLERLATGGQMNLTEQIDNYPGFDEGIDGFTLGEKMKAGAQRFGAKTEYVEVTSVKLSGDIKTVVTSNDSNLCRTVILATGADPRTLGLPREAELTGRGVSYCATCDGMFFRGKTVAVVGGGNTAVAEAIYLSRICEKVVLVHRRDTLRATKIYHGDIDSVENIEFCWNSVPVEIIGNEKVSGLKIKNVESGKESVIDAEGIFVSIGRKPNTELVVNQVTLDDKGYVIAGEDTKTNVPGVFAIGDVRTKELRQVVTAVADGAIAAHYAEEYLSS